jgi:hypothetical protein
MIRKIIIFSENNGTGFNFMKSASNLRLSYMLRSVGYEVKQVHNCLSFTIGEVKQIIEEFTQGEQSIACFSSSFINTTVRKNVLEPDNQDKIGYAWGLDAYDFLVKSILLCKSMGIITLLGGWEIIEDKFQSKKKRFAWGIDTFDKIVDYYVIGNNIDVIDNLAYGKSITYEKINGSKIARTKEVADFTDCASTPLIEDYILEDESLSTEIAAGCIFSCQFCNYAALGKKKTEYMRTYESLERELITNYDNFKTRVYLLTDNIMNDYDEKLKFLIKIREKTGIDIRWSGYVRLDTIKRKEQAQLLLESGIAGATFGIESLKKEAGPSIGKMTDKDKLMKSFEIFRDVIGDNCVTTASFIAGLPNESLDDLYQTYQWLNSAEGKHYIDHYSFTSLLLFKGNETKNDINIGRNDPFSVYERGNGPDRWVSPWGTSEQFSKLAFQFNRNSNGLTAAFTLPFLHNVGLKVENAIKLARLGDESKYKAVFVPLRKNYEKKIQLYKSKMLGM